MHCPSGAPGALSTSLAELDPHSVVILVLVEIIVIGLPRNHYQQFYDFSAFFLVLLADFEKRENCYRQPPR